MKNPLAWFAKNEPVIAGGILSGIGVFFGVRYGSHSTAALQGSMGVGSASFVGLLSRLTTPAARADVQGIANDLASVKEQIGPLSDVKGGLGGWVSWVDKLVKDKGSEILAELEAAKTDALDLLHQKPVVSVPALPTTVAAPVTVSEPTTPGAEPDHLAALAAMLQPPSNVIP